MRNADEEFLRFRGFVGTQKIDIDDYEWKFYDWGPKKSNPVVFLHGKIETAEAFYHQFLSLAVKGYRIVSVQYPPYENFSDLLQGLDFFFEYLGSNSLHLFGSGLGGYLALGYITRFQKRVASLILCNSFCNLFHFRENSLPGIKWIPGFFLKQKLCSYLPNYEVENRIADSIDFIVRQIETLTQEELVTRFLLESGQNIVDPKSEFPFDQNKITIIDSLDNTYVPEAAKEELYQFLPLSSQAFLKSGGIFPFISRHEEVNLYVEVHCRRLNYMNLMVDEESPKSSIVEEKTTKLIHIVSEEDDDTRDEI